MKLALYTLSIIGMMMAFLPADKYLKDPAKIISDASGTNCAQCHELSVRHWQKTHHFKSLKSLKEDSDGQVAAIMKKLGQSGSALASKTCAQCHFTSKKTDKKNEFTGSNIGPAMGVSCESCHGGAREWLWIHQHKTKNDFLSFKTAGRGIPADVVSAIESIQSKVKGGGDYKKVLAEATEKMGMIRPGDVYSLINNCFECHTIPHPDLVNKTEHAAGSEFEILSWLRGEVRHNFQGSNKDNPVNRKIPKDKQRVLYAAGRMLYLEHAMRALAKSPSTEGRYFEEMQARVEEGISNLVEMDEALGGKISGIHAIAEKLKPFGDEISNLKQSALPGLIKELASTNKAFSKSANAGALSALDEAIGEIEPKSSEDD